MTLIMTIIMKCPKYLANDLSLILVAFGYFPKRIDPPVTTKNPPN
jgi:hypothetical protein